RAEGSCLRRHLARARQRRRCRGPRCLAPLPFVHYPPAHISIGAARGMKIVSGGQTGVDRAALDVALELGIPCGGWCPAGREGEDSSMPEGHTPGQTADNV